MNRSAYEQRLMSRKTTNLVQSILLLGGMTLLLALLGWLMAGGLGLLVAAGGVIIVGLGPQVSPQVLLRMYRARQLTPSHAPALFRLIHDLAQRANLTNPPRLYYIPSHMMNAFAIGKRDNAAIAVTDGLLRRLNRRELAGVLAHEISHVNNNDIWVMGLADVVSRLTSVLSLSGQFLLLLSLPMMLFGSYSPPWLLFLLLISAPTLSALFQLALSRTREYDADLDAAWLTGDPSGLASALAKLERYQHGFLERILLPGRRIPDPSLLRTHPTTEDRIQRLLSLNDAEITQPASRSAHFPAEPFSFSTQMPQIVQHPRWRLSGLWF
jgi:heat shock protein HtpX